MKLHRGCPLGNLRGFRGSFGRGAGPPFGPGEVCLVEAGTGHSLMLDGEIETVGAHVFGDAEALSILADDAMFESPARGEFDCLGLAKTEIGSGIGPTRRLGRWGSFPFWSFPFLPGGLLVRLISLSGGLTGTDCKREEKARDEKTGPCEESGFGKVFQGLGGSRLRGLRWRQRLSQAPSWSG